MYTVPLEAVISNRYTIYVGIAQTRPNKIYHQVLKKIKFLSLLLKILLYILLGAFYLSISNTC